jgi:hypothetical protein
MTILSNLLRLFQQSGETPKDVDSDRASSKRTEQVIERYDELLNASRARRRRLPDRSAEECDD